MIPAITPAKSSITCSARVGLGRPERLAEGAGSPLRILEDIGIPQLLEELKDRETEAEEGDRGAQKGDIAMSAVPSLAGDLASAFSPTDYARAVLNILDDFGGEKLRLECVTAPNENFLFGQPAEVVDSFLLSPTIE